MRLSTKGRYGVRFMLDLASSKGGKTVSLGEIAARQGISEKYLWQVIYPLKAAGLIDSTRGAHGGYRLAKPPQDITIADILAPLEGKLTLVECVENTEGCARADRCIARRLWTDLSDRMVQVLDSVNLKDLMDEYDTEPPPPLSYDI